MPVVTTDDGVAISYATAGEGPPHLLFMDGWAGSGRYFDATIEHALRAGVVPPLRARLALLDGGHEVPIEAPHELAALIEAFLAGGGQA
jgi:hypothetical protein